MATSPVTLDFSKAQPITLDFSKAQPIEQKQPTFGEGMAKASFLRNLSEGFGHIADWAEQHRDVAEVAQESEIAKTGKTSTPIAAYTPGAGYDLLSRAARLLSGSTDPKAVLTMAGIGLANTNPFTGIPIDAALVAHGGYGVYKNALAAFSGDPEAAERALLSGSEMAGGAAGIRAQSQLAPAALANFKKLMYSGKVLPDGTPELSKAAQSILHPTQLPENVLRSTIAPPDEVIAKMKMQAGEANATKLDEQMKLVESARQKELAQMERLKNIDAQSRMARQRQQDIIDAQAARNAPQPQAPSPFAGATPTDISNLGTLSKAPLPAAAPSATTGSGIPQGQPSLFPAAPTAPSRIVTPESAAPPINKTLVSYDRGLLVEMAKKGDLNALRELIRNPGNIDVASAVPNSRYLMEANRPTNIYGGPQ